MYSGADICRIWAKIKKKKPVVLKERIVSPAHMWRWRRKRTTSQWLGGQR
jgi:hypothetical protein